MKISRIMSISKILTNLCVIRQRTRIKNTFADIVYNVLLGIGNIYEGLQNYGATIFSEAK